jgi:hypothetical protein
VEELSSFEGRLVEEEELLGYEWTIISGKIRWPEHAPRILNGRGLQGYTDELSKNRNEERLPMRLCKQAQAGAF